MKDEPRHYMTNDKRWKRNPESKMLQQRDYISSLHQKLQAYSGAAIDIGIHISIFSAFLQQVSSSGHVSESTLTCYISYAEMPSMQNEQS